MQKTIKYCKKCLYPETKPDLLINIDGICNACSAYENRKNIDWEQRRTEMISILSKFRNKNGSNWDCIIPVSGGKDSHYQVIKILELGIKPL